MLLGHIIQCTLKASLCDCFFILGFHDQTSEVYHKCYSYQWNTESDAACWCVSKKCTWIGKHVLNCLMNWCLLYLFLDVIRLEACVSCALSIALHWVRLSVQIDWLAVWVSGNALASINVVALHQTRLVWGWVTVCGPVNQTRYVISQLGRLSLLPSVGR